MRRPLRALCATSLLWLTVWPTNTAHDTPPPLSYGTPAKDWTALADRLESQRAWYAWAAQLPAPTSRARFVSRGNHRGYATAKECVSMVEHGGSYDRSSNPSHFGRYQFSRGTWAAYGGNPDTWGTATPAEQDAVFETAWNSPGGPGNWLPYDGC